MPWDWEMNKEQLKPYQWGIRNFYLDEETGLWYLQHWQGHWVKVTPPINLLVKAMIERERAKHDIPMDTNPPEKQVRRMRGSDRKTTASALFSRVAAAIRKSLVSWMRGG